jgi:hypothetical protein
VCQFDHLEVTKMKRQRHLGIVTPASEVTQAKALIADLYRLVDVLNVDIDFREQEAGVSDLARPEYPDVARAMRARRDNLLETISALQERVGRSDVAIWYGNAHI